MFPFIKAIKGENIQRGEACLQALYRDTDQAAIFAYGNACKYAYKIKHKPRRYIGRA